MCISPLKLATGQMISCRKCWQCKENYVRDWVGRCIAETRTSYAAHMVTLTYGRSAKAIADHVDARVLTYSHAQNYLKLLRKYSDGCRYFLAGEYGSLKGRAHWHAIIFWKGRPVPNLQVTPEGSPDIRYMHGVPGEIEGKQNLLWPHGFSHWQDVDIRTVRYVCKYLQKVDEEGQAVFGRSTRPPLGYKYFSNLAEQFVAQGLSPQDYFYYFPEAVNRNGNKSEFSLRGVSAYLYLDCFAKAWMQKHRNENWPQSDIMDEYCDERLRRERIAAGQPEFGETEAKARHELETREKFGLWTQKKGDVASAVAKLQDNSEYRIASTGGPRVRT